MVDDRPDPARPRRRRYHELATTHRAGFVLARVIEWLETSQTLIRNGTQPL
ncbi:hypothetical protein IU479_03640 [Nocardia abscessus]|uniref:hypothetical protein n=1 Tax=Nocardia TaxID=1817 RepID=UPI0018946A9C|nr:MULTISPECIES: hypothetical protein [Nocardia]MBF6217199.1 hypothetical protein [Nocardia abscessus]MDE1670745.1 hypothetical protein [Nocardia gipuzkoensis]